MSFFASLRHRITGTTYQDDLTNELSRLTSHQLLNHTEKAVTHALRAYCLLNHVNPREQSSALNQLSSALSALNLKAILCQNNFGTESTLESLLVRSISHSFEEHHHETTLKLIRCYRSLHHSAEGHVHRFDEKESSCLKTLGNHAELVDRFPELRSNYLDLNQFMLLAQAYESQGQLSKAFDLLLEVHQNNPIHSVLLDKLLSYYFNAHNHQELQQNIIVTLLSLYEDPVTQNLMSREENFEKVKAHLDLLDAHFKVDAPRFPLLQIMRNSLSMENSAQRKYFFDTLVKWIQIPLGPDFSSTEITAPYQMNKFYRRELVNSLFNQPQSDELRRYLNPLITHLLQIGAHEEIDLVLEKINAHPIECFEYVVFELPKVLIIYNPAKRMAFNDAVLDQLNETNALSITGCIKRHIEEHLQAIEINYNLLQLLKQMATKLEGREASLPPPSIYRRFFSIISSYIPLHKNESSPSEKALLEINKVWLLGICEEPEKLTLEELESRVTRTIKSLSKDSPDDENIKERFSHAANTLYQRFMRLDTTIKIPLASVKEFSKILIKSFDLLKTLRPDDYKIYLAESLFMAKCADLDLEPEFPSYLNSIKHINLLTKALDRSSGKNFDLVTYTMVKSLETHIENNPNDPALLEQLTALHEKHLIPYVAYFQDGANSRELLQEMSFRYNNLMNFNAILSLVE